jgi:tRNA A58 N-methylase Trm61
MATLKFGTSEDTTYGVVQNKGNNNSVEVAEARDHLGRVIAQQAYSKSREKQIEVLFDTSATYPEPGTAVTVDGESFLVLSCNETEANTEFKKATLTLSKKDAAALVEYQAPAAGTGG